MQNHGLIVVILLTYFIVKPVYENYFCAEIFFLPSLNLHKSAYNCLKRGKVFYLNFCLEFIKFYILPDAFCAVHVIAVQCITVWCSTMQCGAVQ